MTGSGYPNGLKGGQITIGARILAVADVVEAISSSRPYRKALGIDAALREGEQGKGKLYDAAAVDACLTLFREKGLPSNQAAQSTRCRNNRSVKAMTAQASTSDMPTPSFR